MQRVRPTSGLANHAAKPIRESPFPNGIRPDLPLQSSPPTIGQGLPLSSQWAGIDEELR